MAEKELGKFKLFWGRFYHRHSTKFYCGFIIISSWLITTAVFSESLWGAFAIVIFFVWAATIFAVLVLVGRSFKTPEYKLEKVIKEARVVVSNATTGISKKIEDLIATAKQTKNPRELKIWVEKYKQVIKLEEAHITDIEKKCSEIRVRRSVIERMVKELDL